MSNLHPYVIFNGNAAEAIAFYEKSLGASVEFITHYKDAPFPVEENWKQTVLHASLLINDSRIMFSDSSPEHQVQFGDNVSLSLNFEKKFDIDAQFAALAKEGNIKMPLQKTFWAEKFGMLVDKFGIHWMFNQD